MYSRNKSNSVDPSYRGQHRINVIKNGSCDPTRPGIDLVEISVVLQRPRTEVRRNGITEIAGRLKALDSGASLLRIRDASANNLIRRRLGKFVTGLARFIVTSLKNVFIDGH